MAADVNDNDKGFRELFLQLSDDITSTELAKIKFISKTFKLGAGTLEELTEFWELLEILWTRRIIEPSNVDPLYYFMEQVNRLDLKKKVEDFARRNDTSIHSETQSVKLTFSSQTPTTPEVCVTVACTQRIKSSHTPALETCLFTKETVNGRVVTTPTSSENSEHLRPTHTSRQDDSYSSRSDATLLKAYSVSSTLKTSELMLISDASTTNSTPLDHTQGDLDCDSGCLRSLASGSVNSSVNKNNDFSVRQKSVGSEQHLVSSVLDNLKITLWKYQEELAVPGLEGKNSIICAPTGSGKTFTAGHICRHHLRNARQENKKFTALFIVCIRNLIAQQAEALKLIVSSGDCDGTVGAINDTAMLSDLMKVHDVSVVTAQILVNCLNRKEVKIGDIDLLIMDECHHTNLQHPYNAIMRAYQKEWRENQSAKLPQVVGLTASLGVGSEAKLHYIRMCANLNCTSITHVRDRDNMIELLLHNPKPKQDQIIVVEPRHSNMDFSRLIVRVMIEVEKIVGLSNVSSRPSPGIQAYENWIVLQRQIAERIGKGDLIIACEALQRLNGGLVLFDELRAVDAKRHLDTYFNNSYLASNPTDVAVKIYRLYTDASDELQRLVDSETVNDNQKLTKLCKLLVRLLTNNSDARGIVLTRTRLAVVALVDFIRQHEDLKDLAVPDKLVGKGQKEDTMTDEQQETTLRLFRQGLEDGGVNLLVATDVAQEGLDMPKCNFVIRYNFVSNEIGSVQSKGRARAPNSECYLIVNRGSVNQKKEHENLLKEHQMLQALDEIDKVPEEELRILISRMQVGHYASMIRARSP